MHLLFAALLTLGQTHRIDAIVRQVMQDRAIPGLALGIARGNEILYLRGYGVRDVARGAPADGLTIFRIGSLTKQFAAALVLQQVAAGRLDLRAPVAGGATVAQLLGQTAAGVAGTTWQYDNANYVALERLLARTTGSPFPLLLQTQIAGPLALVSTADGLPPFAENVARGDGVASGSPPPEAGAMSSNARDLLVWLRDLRAGRVVPQPLFDAMTSSGKLADGTPTHYGYGFFVDDWYGYRVAEHSGYVPGFSARDALVLDDGLEIVVLTNRTSVDLAPLCKSILAIVDLPRDANLAARLGSPAQNENPRITAAVREILSAQPFAAYGALERVEFIERTNAGAISYDRYRVTFASGQWRMTVGYRADGAIASLEFVPAP